MTGTVETGLSAAASEQQRAAAGITRETKGGRPAQQNARRKPIGGTRACEAVVMLLALFPCAAPAGAAGMSSVTIGAQVKFARYETVKLLDRHFTVEMQAGAKNPFHIADIDAARTVIIL